MTLTARIMRYVGKYPFSTAGEIASDLGLNRTSVQSILVTNAARKKVGRRRMKSTGHWIYFSNGRT